MGRWGDGEMVREGFEKGNAYRTVFGIKQRWLIVESAERKKSDIQKLELKIEQEKKTALKLAKKLETTGFDTVTQAQKQLTTAQLPFPVRRAFPG